MTSLMHINKTKKTQTQGDRLFSRCERSLKLNLEVQGSQSVIALTAVGPLTVSL